MKVKLDEYAFPPERAHRQDAGMDIRSPFDFVVKAHDSFAVDTGVHFEIPYGYVGMVKSKSGLNFKHGITTEGVVDSGYTNSVWLKIYNNSDEDKEFLRGDKLTQIVFLPVLMDDIEIVEEIHGGERGERGFGSTGR